MGPVGNIQPASFAADEPTGEQQAMDSLQQQAADLFGLDLSAAQISAFERYSAELLAWNAHTNLTAITEPNMVRVRHFLDSLSVTQAVTFCAGHRVIDVGTGAGFPGVPLALVYPDIHMTLLEATGKKIAFLDHLQNLLSLSNVTTLKALAEEAGQDTGHRATYDIVLARAVARLPALLEYLLPLATVGGVCVAMKGATAQQEIQDSATALATLGGELVDVQVIPLPGVDDPHYLITVRKTRETPTPYPRQPGIPTRKPL
ncbi:MAG: 16S rRNA (guanine(527)-N(7))-methyltransferase RsmG [Chloroflexota bacterium]